MCELAGPLESAESEERKVNQCLTPRSNRMLSCPRTPTACRLPMPLIPHARRVIVGVQVLWAVISCGGVPRDRKATCS
jgi:hypothetical protein